MAAPSIRLNIQAEHDELCTLQEVRSLIEDSTFEGRYPQLISDGEAIDLPESLHRVLREVVPLLLEGKSVNITTAQEEITTQQAADILNVSRQHVVNLITAGEIQAHKVGTHRRIAMQDLMEYRERRRTAQDEALDELARLSLKEGMYTKHPRAR